MKFIIIKPAHAFSLSLGRLRGFGVYEPTEKQTGSAQITLIFSNLFAFLTIVGSLIFVVQFLLGALNWISSSGEPDKVQKAQNKMVHAAIGFIAVVAAYSLAFIVSKVLGIDILNPARYIEGFWGET